MKHLAPADTAVIAALVDLLAAVEAVGIDRYANISYYKALTTLGGEVSIGDNIERARVYDTSTSAVISTIWTNEETGLVLSTPPIIGTDVALIGSTTLTAAEYAATIGKVSIDQTAGQNVVAVSARICVSHQQITVPITTGVTLASLCSGGIIPVGAVTAEIQALDAIVRCGLQSGVTVTPTTGKRINVDEALTIDSTLASVTLVAQSGVAACSVAFFNMV